MNLPLVRLSRDREWAVCCDVNCGVRFARRIRFPRRTDIEEFERGLPQALLDFGSGWVQSNTVDDLPLWWMSQRAWKRLSQGRQPAFRRAPNFDVLGWKDGEVIRGERRDREDRPQRFSTNADLPAVVVCPACDCRQLADADVLGCR